MIKRSIQSAIIVALVIIALGLSARTLVIAPNDQKETASTSKAQPQTSSNAASAREQLEEMHRLDDRLLSTVHWALGVVVFLAVLLSGFSWYTNFRVYERDRSNLRDEMRVFLSQELETTREQFRSKFEQSQEAIRRGLKEELDTFNSRLTDTGKASSQSLKDLEERISNKFSHGRYDFLNLKIELEEVAKAPASNRLTTYIEYLQVVIEFEWTWAYVEPLKKIEALMRDGGKISSGELVQFNTILGKIPKDFSPFVDSIRTLIPTHTLSL